MIKVLITSGCSNPPLTLTYCCDTMRYFATKGKVAMYNEKGKLIYYFYIDEWKEVLYIDHKGEKHYIKRG